VLLSVARGAVRRCRTSSLDAGPHHLDRLLLGQQTLPDARLLERVPARDHGLVKTLAEELGPKGITVNLIAARADRHGARALARRAPNERSRRERRGRARRPSEREIPLGR